MNRSTPNWPRPLGELVIVIVGVLIALAGDRWNEARVQRSTASGYLDRLEAVLVVDLEEYRAAASGALAVDSAALYVLGVLHGAVPPESEYQRLVRSLLVASWAPRPRSTREVYEEMINTGNLSLLPPDMRAGITSYYNLVDLYNGREASFAGQLERAYWTIPSRVLGPDLLPRAWHVLSGRPISHEPTPEELPVEPQQIAEMIRRLRGIPEVEAYLAQVRHFHVQRQVIYGERLTAAAEALQRTLERK